VYLFANNWYAEARIRTGAVAQLQDDAEHPPERLLQAVWGQQRLLRHHLQTLDGENIRVLHPGFQNLEGGPDFRGAVLQFGEQRPRSGDVEVDLRPSGWRAHGHDVNPAFRNVLLHVIWDGEEPAAAGLKTLKLRGVLDAPVGELSLLSGAEVGRGLGEGFTGKCSGELRRLGESGVEKLLCEAAAVRLEAKAAAFRARARQTGWDQALWEGLFRGLGYKHNSWAMQWLAESLPRMQIETPREDGVLLLQSRLLGASGLLPSDLPGSAKSGSSYVRRVWDVWWRERESFAECMLPRTLWRLHGLRPANHPQRRLALGARWLVSEDLPSRLKDWCMQDIPAGKLCASLAEVLEVGTDDFWSWHWSLGSARLPRPQRLLGLGRVSDLGVNVVLPWLYARTSGDGVRGAEGLRDRVTDRYFAWRATEDNSVLRLARKRLLASGSGPGYELQVRFSRAALQQGLLQIVRDFCEASNAICEGCPLPAALRNCTQ